MWIIRLCPILLAIAGAGAQSLPEVPEAGDILLTHVSGPERPGMGSSCRISATAVVPMLEKDLDFDRDRFGFYSLKGKRMGTALTRAIARREDGSTAVGMVYLPPVELANFRDGIHHGLLRKEEGARAARAEELSERLRALLEGGISFELIDPAGNRYEAALPPLARMSALLENVEYHGLASFAPREVVDEAVALEDAGDLWFDLRILRAGDAFPDAVQLSFAWCNGRLEQRSYRDVFARRLRAVVRSPGRWAHLALGNPWWRGQAGAELELPDGRAWDVYCAGERAAMRLQHGAALAQNLLIHDGSAGAEAAQVRADYEEFFCAIPEYRSLESVYPVPPKGSWKQALSSHRKILASMRERWQKPVDPLTAQAEIFVPLVRYEPGTGYAGICTNSRFAVATAMTASPDMAQLNRLYAWSAMTFPVLCYHAEGDRLRFDDPARHLRGEGEHRTMPMTMSYLPPAPDGRRASDPAAQRWGRVQSAQEKALLERMEGWTIYPLPYGQEDVVDIAHHTRSSVYGGQGGLVQACPEYRLYAGAHASLFNHTYGGWSNGVIAGQWARARKEQAASGEMPGWAHEETRTNANQFLHAAWGLLADLDDPAFKAATLDGVRAWIECLHAIRHPRGLNFCQTGKFTLYPTTDGQQVELLPILAGTYQLGWVENCANQLLRALRQLGHQELARKLDELLSDCTTLVLAHPAMVNPDTGGMAFYVKCGFAGLDPPSKWSLTAGKRRYEVQGKVVEIDFSRDRSYDDRFEHHFCAYLSQYERMRESDPAAARKFMRLAARAFPALQAASRKTAQELAEGRDLHWDLPAATLILLERVERRKR